jgi:hypothetical protein
MSNFLSEWLRDNLIQSCRERSFTVAQVNLMTFKYKEDTKLTEEDFNLVMVVTVEVQAEIDAELEAQRLAEELANLPTEEEIV